jgi:hypothetical protein
MTRTSIITAAAFATLTGCAQTIDQTDAQGLAVSGFAGITRTLPLTQMSANPALPGNGDNGDGNPNSDWAPADMPAGTYWMTVNEVSDLQGDAEMEPGDRQLSYVTAANGAPMLQGMAPIMSNGEQLSAERVDIVTAAIEDGRCKVTSILSAQGEQTGPDTFDMFVFFEDSVEGEDCYKLGYGDEKVEIASFQASFSFIPPVADGPKDSETPSEDPNMANN